MVYYFDELGHNTSRLKRFEWYSLLCYSNEIIHLLIRKTGEKRLFKTLAHTSLDASNLPVCLLSDGNILHFDLAATAVDLDRPK